MKKIIFLLIYFIILILATKNVNAADVLVFDSTDHYLGGCQLTNKSEWELKEDVNVTKFQVWYNWNQGETTLPVSVYLDGKKFAEFEAIRADCDPYQKQWCNADFAINKLFAKGKYSTEIPNTRQCLKPGGTGAIRLYKEEAAVKKEELSPTSTITPIPTTEKDRVPLPPSIVSPPPSICSCSQTIIIIVATATSAIVSFLVALLLRR